MEHEMIQLDAAQISYITQVTNARGAVFAAPGPLPMPYTFLTTGIIANDHLQIAVTLNSNGEIFSAAQNVRGALPDPPSPDLDAIISNILLANERAIELKPA